MQCAFEAEDDFDLSNSVTRIFGALKQILGGRSVSDSPANQSSFLVAACVYAADLETSDIVSSPGRTLTSPTDTRVTIVAFPSDAEREHLDMCHTRGVALDTGVGNALTIVAFVILARSYDQPRKLTDQLGLPSGAPSQPFLAT